MLMRCCSQGGASAPKHTATRWANYTFGFMSNDQMYTKMSKMDVVMEIVGRKYSESVAY